MSAAVIVHLVLAALCLLWIVGTVVGLGVLRTVPTLSRVQPPERFAPPTETPTETPTESAVPPRSPTAPFLTILVPASNEAGDAASIADLRAAHASRLVAAQTLAAAGPGLATEIVYLEDRSTDDTAAILEELAATSLPTGAATGGSAVTVRTLRIRELPEGWLGKTHALERGLQATATAGAAAGGGSRWVLFSDADVRLSPDALRITLAHAEARGLEHLTLMPQLEQGGLLRDATMGAFGRVFSLSCRLWAVNDPSSTASVGVGAFNLVRRAALARVGGMQRVRLEVGDDMALGALLRQSGARQGVANGRDLVRLAWYRSVGGLVAGVEKGMFAYGARCEPWRLFGLAAVLVALELAPWAAMAIAVAAALAPGGAPGLAPGLALGGSSAWWSLALGLLGFIAVAGGMLAVGLGERWLGRSMRPALLLPVGGLIIAWAALRAGWLGWRRGGVLWRGTFYPSALLREGLAWEGGTRGGRRRDG